MFSQIIHQPLPLVQILSQSILEIIPLLYNFFSLACMFFQIQAYQLLSPAQFPQLTQILPLAHIFQHILQTPFPYNLVLLFLRSSCQLICAGCISCHIPPRFLSWRIFHVWTTFSLVVFLFSSPMINNQLWCNNSYFCTPLDPCV